MTTPSPRSSRSPRSEDAPRRVSEDNLVVGFGAPHGERLPVSVRVTPVGPLSMTDISVQLTCETAATYEEAREPISALAASLVPRGAMHTGGAPTFQEPSADPDRGMELARAIHPDPLLTPDFAFDPTPAPSEAPDDTPRTIYDVTTSIAAAFDAPAGETATFHGEIAIPTMNVPGATWYLRARVTTAGTSSGPAVTAGPDGTGGDALVSPWVEVV